jgi:hypothetical protein
MSPEANPEGGRDGERKSGNKRALGLRYKYECTSIYYFELRISGETRERPYVARSAMREGLRKTGGNGER